MMSSRWNSHGGLIAAFVLVSALLLTAPGVIQAAAAPNKAADDLTAQAQSAMNKGNADEAAKLFRRALEQAPDRVELYLLRSRALDSSGKLEEAIDAASKYIELQPDDAAGYLNRARIYSSQEKNEEALKDANKAIELSPKEPDGYYRRADIYTDMKKPAEAKADEAMAEKLDN